MIDRQSWGTVDGFDIVATVVPDTDAETAGAVGVIVTASSNGVEYGADSIWEVDTAPDLSDTSWHYRADLIAGAVDAARAEYTRVAESHNPQGRIGV